MSYMIFPVAGFRVNEEAVRKHCPETFRKFESLLKKYDVSKKDLAVLSEEELLECICKEHLDEINDAWESLKECFQEKTGISLALVAAGSNLEYAEDPSSLEEGFYAIDIEDLLESLEIPAKLVVWCEGG